jgi:hypothetical protein
MAEAKVDDEWKHHPLREFLRLELINGILPIDSSEGSRPVDVWNKYCDVRPDLFEGMLCNELFKSRLSGLRSQTKRDLNRAEQDLEAFDIHRQNFPFRPLDSLGRPNWFGSAAEKLLEQDIAAGLDTMMKPKELRATRAEYMEFTLEVFRGHIHQAIGAAKYKHTLKLRDEEKKKARALAREKKIAKAAKKAAAEQKATEKAVKKAAKEAAKAAKTGYGAI